MKIFALFLLLSSNAAPDGVTADAGGYRHDDRKTTEADLSVLGVNNLEDRMNGTVEVTVNEDDCQYELTVTYRPNLDTLPLVPEGQEPAFCVPPSAGGPAPPQVYEGDDVPYFVDRWNWLSLSNEIRAATGFNHISIDWNACGHPPFNLFGRVHTDIHMYRISPEFRATTMICDTVGTSPRCATADQGGQSTQEGLDFFVLPPTNTNEDFINVPPGYSFNPGTAIRRMGSHLWNFDTEPDNVATWVEPITIVGSYGGEVIFFEPMIPYIFTSGDESKTYVENLTYVEQTILNLPTSYSVDYDGTTQMTTIVVRGTSDSCESSGTSLATETMFPYVKTFLVTVVSFLWML